MLLKGNDMDPRVRLYLDMIRARKMEDAILELFKKGEVPGSTHLSQGQEAGVFGLVSCLRQDDYAIGTYRGHNLALAKGVSMREIFSEVLGKATGSNGGFGGSMHITKREVGLIGNFSVVGAGIPVATGLALASKLKQDNRITACFFGDGTTNIGYFHESLNMAAVFGCPIVYVIENNLYSEYTPISTITKIVNLAERGKAYGIGSLTCDGNDVDEVIRTSRQVIEKVRSTSQPILLELMTYRRSGHSKTDDGVSYRPEAERKHWFERDPIVLYGAKLSKEGILTQPLDEQLRKRADSEVEDALRFAREAAFPDSSGLEQVEFSEPAPAGEDVPTGSPASHASFRSAIRQGIIQSMERDQAIVFFGEDIAKAGGVFKVTEGILTRFGPKRVWDTPIAENSMMGMALGLAIGGYRPMLEIMFADFLYMAMDALANSVAKIRWTSGGQYRVPVFVRTACGAASGFASHHSQTLDSLLLAVPGLKIVTPSNAYDAKGLLCASLRENNPVVFFEHKSLYNRTAPVPSEYYTVPLGKANVVKEGNDVTVVANMAMVSRTLEAAGALGTRGISAEVIDIRCLRPLDIDTIEASVKNTGRLVTVEETPVSGGWGNLVAASISEKAIYSLAAPIKRVGVKDLPIPFSPVLEDVVVPSVDLIQREIENVVSSSNR